jgi:hypothetical protein
MSDSNDTNHDNDNGDRPPLVPPLPMPPVAHLGGQRFVLERVNINELDKWREEHGLVRVGKAFLGKPGWRESVDGKMYWSGYGWAAVHWPRQWIEETEANE